MVMRKLWSIRAGVRSAVALALAGALTVAPIAVGSAAAAPNTITVGSNPFAVAVDAVTHTVYVANSGDGTVSVIDETTGTVTGTIPVGSFPYGVAVDAVTQTVYVTNGNDGTVSVLYEAEFTSGSPSAGVAGAAYTFTLTATGNPAPTFAVTNGALPAGLTLDPATGVISGTPTTAGPTTFTVTATNGVGQPAAAIYTLTIAAPDVAPTLTSGAPAAGVTGTAYTFTLTATGNPAPTFAVTNGALPAGLTLDPATGVISGTPTTAGPTTFTVTATNGVGQPAAATYTLTIGAAAATTNPVANAASTQRLASTGFDPGPAGLIGALLVILGAGALSARRRATRQR